MPAIAVVGDGDRGRNPGVDTGAAGRHIADMARIIFITSDDARYEVDAPAGSSVMENAVRSDVPGIDADCGGACACATCHVYVDEAWREKVGLPSEMEEDMLDFASELQPNSRLSCQIRMSEALDGLLLRVPTRQG